MEKKLSLWEILVPKYSNSGTKYNLEHHKIWDEAVQSIANGMTIYGCAKGYWVSPQGRLFADEMIPVRVYCSEADIERIVEHTLKHYNQEAVFAYEVSSNVKVVCSR